MTKNTAFACDTLLCIAIAFAVLFIYALIFMKRWLRLQSSFPHSQEPVY